MFCEPVPLLKSILSFDIVRACFGDLVSNVSLGLLRLEQRERKGEAWAWRKERVAAETHSHSKMDQLAYALAN